MKKFYVRLSVKDSRGNEQAKVFNFNTVENMDLPKLYSILGALVKESYSMHIEGYYKKHRGEALSFEQLCKSLIAWRFYETKTVYKEITSDAWQYVTSLDFPCDIHVRSFHSDWGGTFFEITSDEKLVNISFDGVKAHLEKYNIDLFKSKTEGLWYTHRWIELTDIHNSILIRKKDIVHEWITKTEKIEL